MTMKKAICVVAHDNYSYPVRVKYLEELLKRRGYDVTVLSSDFDHRNKTEYINSREGLVLLHVRPYKKNLSISRLLSHREFAMKSEKYLEEHTPDLVFASGAPNSIYKYISRYKKRNDNTVLIFDVTDLWPETLPLPIFIKKLAFLPLYLWKNIRVKSLKLADYILFECEMFQKIVREDNRLVCGSTVYLCEEDFPPIFRENSDNDCVNLLYLGSINNIIDIELIAKIVKAFSGSRKVNLNIIGEGEKKAELIEAVELSGGKCIFHGIIYDNEKKSEIFKNCQFALNIMKDSVCVGATMKSIEYFRAGIPLINNIGGDTKEIVSSYSCGVNISNETLEYTIKELILMNNEQLQKMKINSRKVYSDYFSPRAFEKKIEPILDKLEGKKNE